MCANLITETHNSQAWESDQFSVRSFRQKNWFWIDNGFIDDYAALIGPSPIATYVCLARFADSDHQTCWPSYKKISESIGVSAPTVIKSICILQIAGLIRLEQNTHETEEGKVQFTSNIYTLLDIEHLDEEKKDDIRNRIDEFKERGKEILEGGVIKNFDRGYKDSLEGVIKNLVRNKTQFNKTQEKDSYYSEIEISEVEPEKRKPGKPKKPAPASLTETPSSHISSSAVVKKITEKRKGKNPNQAHDACRAYFEVMGFNPVNHAADMIAAQVTNIPLWKKVLSTLVLRGRSPKDVDLALSWYKNPNLMERPTYNNNNRTNGYQRQEPGRVPVSQGQIDFEREQLERARIAIAKRKAEKEMSNVQAV